MKLYKIALSGGPCAGKTTIMCKIEEYFTALGYKVILIEETATNYITHGMTKENFPSAYDFQQKIFTLQMTKEDVAGSDALDSGAEKILIVCDRGLPDNEGYLSPSDFYRLLRNNNITKQDILLRYDAIFYLETIAKTDPNKYREICKDTIRTESPEKACEIDEKLLFAWGDHPNFFCEESGKTLEEKTSDILKTLTDLLDEEPIVEKKRYVIQKPDPTIFDAKKQRICLYKVGENDSIYSISSDNSIRYKRIRDKGEEYIDGGRAADIIKSCGFSLRKIPFDRYAFFYDDNYMFVDIYDDLTNATLTVMKKTKGETKLPDGIKVIAPMIG